MLARTQAPPIILPESFELVRAESKELNNNVSIHFINAGDQDVLRLELIFHAGTKYENNRGSSYFASRMMGEGVKEYTSKQIIDYLDFYGAFFEINQNADSINLTFYTLKRFVKEIAFMAKKFITEATFPEDELSNLKNITLQNLKVNLQKSSFIASNYFRELLFGADHPYGKNLTEDDISGVSRGAVVDFYNELIAGKDFDIVLAGKIDDEIKSFVTSTFQGIVVSAPGEKRHTLKNTEVKGESLVVEKEENLQSSLRIGYKTISKNHKDYFNLVMINEILGGYFGSRLMKNIREEKGFTYGISSNIVNYQDDSYFVVGTDVKKEFTGQTLEEVEKEINILRNSLIPKEELEIVKNYLIGSFLGSINTPFALADKFKSIYYFNLDYSFYQSFLSSIKASTPSQLIETANQYLDYSAMNKVIVGGF